MGRGHGGPILFCQTSNHHTENPDEEGKQLCLIRLILCWKTCSTSKTSSSRLSELILWVVSICLSDPQITSHLRSDKKENHSNISHNTTESSSNTEPAEMLWEAKITKFRLMNHLPLFRNIALNVKCVKILSTITSKLQKYCSNNKFNHKAWTKKIYYCLDNYFYGFDQWKCIRLFQNIIAVVL